MKHLGQLKELELVDEERLEGESVYKLTDRGRAFVLEFIKVEKFAEAFGITI
jgi:predicted transcriptional regulator